MWIEQGIVKFTKNNKIHTYITLACCTIITCAISAFSVKYYKTQGVVRDIPELEVTLNDPSSWEPQEYNERITTLYEKPFPPKNGKKNILVVGDSYARDWINILLESHIEDVNIVYSKNVASDLRKKIAQADIIFLANNAPTDIYIDYLPSMLQKKFYRVGHKGFGYGVGCLYNQARLTGDYTTTIPYKSDRINADERIEYQGMYINMMDAIRNTDGSIIIFTSDKRLISHDGLHLTRAGAKEFAKRIDVKSIVSI